ncbi:hypothetical protein DdX_15427 [Ditylenchus destructor]|uniref:Uncharacterized protein n=1 Tax=Ditylenchus destructor TaxID=166010 RepID=A0AAD4MSB8_9BILA|nr:hypothetical protein DdX_15427 [Ditylenchus destructor]
MGFTSGGVYIVMLFAAMNVNIMAQGHPEFRHIMPTEIEYPASQDRILECRFNAVPLSDAKTKWSQTIEMIRIRLDYILHPQHVASVLPPDCEIISFMGFKADNDEKVTVQGLQPMIGETALFAFETPAFTERSLVIYNIKQSIQDAATPESQTLAIGRLVDRLLFPPTPIYLPHDCRPLLTYQIANKHDSGRVFHLLTAYSHCPKIIVNISPQVIRNDLVLSELKLFYESINQ